MPQHFNGTANGEGIPLRRGEGMPFGFDGRISQDGIPLRYGENMPDEDTQHQRYKDIMRIFGYGDEDEVEDINRGVERQGIASEARNPLMEFLSALLFKR